MYVVNIVNQFSIFIFIYTHKQTYSDDDNDNIGNDDNDNRQKQRIVQLKEHLTKETYDILIGNNVNDDVVVDSNEQFENEMYNEARNHVNGVHVVDSNNIIGVIPSTSLCFNKFSEQSSTYNHGQQQTSIIPKDSFISNNPSSSNHDNKLENQINADEKEKILDELFYDPDEDDSNQKWIDKKKFQYESRITSLESDSNVDQDDKQRINKLQSDRRLKKPRSDATLNCPCCLSLLCLDCQRHEIYKTQYRAMFVLNCRIDFERKLFFKNKDELRKKFQKRKKRLQQENKMDEQSSSLTGDQYYPVHCNICNTQVAVYDLDEVYHFFTVIASH